MIIYPASGTGAWEAALVNTMSPGDNVLMYETGHFASLWKNLAVKLGLKPEFIASDWRSGVDPAAIEKRLRADTGHEIKAVCVVHNETSTGATSPDRRGPQGDRRCRPSRTADGRHHLRRSARSTIAHDDWGVDVTVGGSQKGLMLPPGISFNAVSEKALAASKDAKLPRSFWAWDEMIANNKNGFFPYTPATNLLYALADGHRHAARGRSRQRLRAPQASCRSHAPRRRRLGPREPEHRARTITRRCSPPS